MMYLYGASTCESCDEARDSLLRTPLEFQYVDVSTIPGFEGGIPQLQTEDGTVLYGLPQIINYIKQMGFRI
ncbi:MAG TPA: glutaredoxin family protein [Candidatus Glassbacteria bacterium]|nr:glutaredoxin family protein [Candidatus Glassbacteria bacterium]